MQLIIITETDPSAQIDETYIRCYINHFFPWAKRNYHSRPISLSGKNKYREAKKKVLKEIKQYEFSKAGDGKTEVVMALDADEGGPSELVNSDIQCFCKENSYHLVFFHRDVEEVFLGHRVSDSEKKRCVKAFANKPNLGSEPDKRFLIKTPEKPVPGTTNLGTVLGQIFGKYFPTAG